MAKCREHAWSGHVRARKLVASPLHVRQEAGGETVGGTF